MMTFSQLDVRWRQRLENYRKALAALEMTAHAWQEKQQAGVAADIEKMALIQAFEMSFELAWKTLKDYMESLGEQAPFPRIAIKSAFEHELITDGETYLQMLMDRNTLAHIYDDAKATELAMRIATTYRPLLVQLADKLVSYEQ